jgi:hypothetical protein
VSKTLSNNSTLLRNESPLLRTLDESVTGYYLMVCTTHLSRLNGRVQLR